MNSRKHEIMEKYIKGEYAVHDMINHIVQLEEQVRDLNETVWGNKPEPKRAKYHLLDFIIGDRLDAVEVLTKLIESADRYSSVSVADYHDLIGVQFTYVDNGYGWSSENITKSTILEVRGGYIIKFPPLEVM